MKKKVIITDFITDPVIEQEILGKDVDIICLDETREDHYPAVIEDASALLVWHGSMASATFARMRACHVVVRYGTGYETIDISAAREHGITVCNTPDYGVEEVADTACAMILSCVRQVAYYDVMARKITKDWQMQTDLSLKRTSEHVLGIIGCGRIGTAVAVRMKAFGVKVVIFDPNLPAGYEKSLGVQRAEEIAELQSQATIISIHTPLNEGTSGLVDNTFIDGLNSGTILVNTSRGGVVKNTGVIKRGLQNGKLSFVALDVLPDEPPKSTDVLIDEWRRGDGAFQGRLIVNPHSAFYSETSWSEMRVKAAVNVGRVLNGQKPWNILN